MRVLKIGIFILIMGGIIFPLFQYWRISRKENSKSNKDLRNKFKEENISVDDIESSDKKIDNVSFTQNLLDWERIEICSDDIAILQVSEYEYVGYLEVKGVSFNLLSVEERLSLEENYGNLLNGIDFPFQIYVQSRSLNLDMFVERYKDKIKQYKEKVDAIERKLNIATSEDEKHSLQVSLKKSQSQLEYGHKLLADFKVKNIDSKLLERRYYIVLKYFHDADTFDYELSHKEIVEEALNDLSNKASNFTETLGRNNLECHFLNGVEIGELLYNAYNKEDANYFKLNNAIKAKFNHICTTSEPIAKKKIDYEINNCKKNRQQLKKSIKDENDVIEQYELSQKQTFKKDEEENEK